MLARGADPLPEGRSARRGAVAAGASSLAGRTSWTRRFTGWTRTCSRIPHEEIWYAEGRAPVLEGTRAGASQGQKAAARPAATSSAVREYPLSRVRVAGARRACVQLHARRRAALVTALRAKGPRRPRCPFAARAAVREAGFLRAVDLARMGQGGDARRELARLGLRDRRRQARAAATAQRGRGGSRLDHRRPARSRRDYWSASHSIPRYTLRTTGYSIPRGSDAGQVAVAYPRAFPELVAKNARANGISEALQLAIMREESAFSPRIESFANAIGLTQMLVKTAQRFANGTGGDARRAARPGQERGGRLALPRHSCGSTSAPRPR